MAKLDGVEKSIIFDENLNPILITEILVSQDLMLMNTLELKGTRIIIDHETNEVKMDKKVIILAPFTIQDISVVE